MRARRFRPLPLGVIAAGVVTLATTACTPHPEDDPLLGAGFVDHFNRSSIGSNYRNTGGPYHIENGALVVSLAHNHPLWLKRRLPHDVRVELDAMSRSADGDIKVELFGNGMRHESTEAVAADRIYTASGYVFIFGGWRNSRSVLVRQNEHTWQHDPSVPLRTTPRVIPDRRYHWVITRRGGHLAWSIDGKPFLSWNDPHPLGGPGQDHFAFDGWESELVFDNLKITPLPPRPLHNPLGAHSAAAAGHAVGGKPTRPGQPQ